MDGYRVTIGEGGRVVIPAIFRKAMKLEKGDELILRMQDNELRMYQQAVAVERLRALVRNHTRAPEYASSTDEFIANRRRDWGNE